MQQLKVPYNGSNALATGACHGLSVFGETKRIGKMNWQNELAKRNRSLAVIDYCYLMNEALNILLAISLIRPGSEGDLHKRHNLPSPAIAVLSRISERKHKFGIRLSLVNDNYFSRLSNQKQRWRMCGCTR